MEQRTFYSHARELYIAMNTGTIAIGEDGKARRYGEKFIQFKNPANGKFGSYSTTDPEAIEYLEKRSKEVGDILTEAQYIEACTPVEQKVGEANRKLEESNKLLADLRAREAELEARLAQLEPASKASKK